MIKCNDHDLKIVADLCEPFRSDHCVERVNIVANCAGSNPLNLYQCRKRQKGVQF